jgi:hypothetical protein
MPDPLSAGLLLKLDITVWTGSAALSAPDLGLDPASVARSIPSRPSSARRAMRSTV